MIPSIEHYRNCIFFSSPSSLSDSYFICVDISYENRFKSLRFITIHNHTRTGFDSGCNAVFN